jgi:hypothetical protein
VIGDDIGVEGRLRAEAFFQRRLHLRDVALLQIAQECADGCIAHLRQGQGASGPVGLGVGGAEVGFVGSEEPERLCALRLGDEVRHQQREAADKQHHDGHQLQWLNTVSP